MDKIKTVIEIKLYETDIKIFGKRDYLIDLYRQPFKRAISNRDIILVRLLLNHITNDISFYSKHSETRDSFLIYMMRSAFEHEAYFIFHILFMHLKSKASCERKLIDALYYICPKNLYILQYVLKNGNTVLFANKFIENGFRYSMAVRESVSLWLLLCYIEDIHRVTSNIQMMSHVILNSSQNPKFTVLFCGIMLKLGVSKPDDILGCLKGKLNEIKSSNIQKYAEIMNAGKER